MALAIPLLHELLSIAELSKIAVTTPHIPGHGPLLEALTVRYPGTPFHVVAESDGHTWGSGIIDSVGHRVTNTLGKWVDQELAAAGGSAREVWSRHKDKGLIRTEWEGSVLYLTSMYGSDPDAFYQIEYRFGAEVATQYLFESNTMFPPEDRFDLVSGPCTLFGDSKRNILSPPQYHMNALINIRRFLRDLVEVDKSNRLAELTAINNKVIRVQDICLGPEGWQTQTSEDVPFLDMCSNWMDRIPPAVRLFQDWQNSSAGRLGERFCVHWWIHTKEWTDYEGRRRLIIVPQWAEADGGISLPEISPGRDASPYGVMEKLVQFDRLAGYPFAWYFYMLHGNRVVSSAAMIIANAVKDGLLNLPECDERVLLQWSNNQYGF